MLPIKIYETQEGKILFSIRDCTNAKGNFLNYGFREVLADQEVLEVFDPLEEAEPLAYLAPNDRLPGTNFIYKSIDEVDKAFEECKKFFEGFVLVTSDLDKGYKQGKLDGAKGTRETLAHEEFRPPLYLLGLELGFAYGLLELTPVVSDCPSRTRMLQEFAKKKGE